MKANLHLLGARTGNCLRTTVALEEAGLSYRPVPVDLRRLEHRGAEHLELNPAGKVPVLVDETGLERLVLSQSNAIMLHVADMAGERLLPTNVHPRAIALERFFYFTTDVIALSHSAFLLRGSGGEAASEMLMYGAVTAMSASGRYLTADYMAGGQFSLADISAFTIAASIVEWIDWKMPNENCLGSLGHMIEQKPPFGMKCSGVERVVRTVPERERFRDVFGDHILMVTLAGQTEFSASRIDRLPLEEREDVTDAISFTPATRERTILLSRGSLNQVRISIPPAFVLRACDIDKEPTWSAPYNAQDARSAATMRALLRVHEEGPISRIHHDTLMITLARRIGQRFGRIEPRSNDTWLSPAALRQVLARIEDDPSSSPSLAELSRVAGLSASGFLRAFRGSVGQSPGSYLVSRRIARAATMLRNTELSISEVAQATGFRSAARFSTIFGLLQGSEPAQFRRATDMSVYQN